MQSQFLSATIIRDFNDKRFEREVCKMAKCAICGKAKVFSMQVSHSHRRSSRDYKPNLRSVRANVDGSPKKIMVCSRCLRSGKVERV